MRESEKKNWVKLLTGGNTKALIPKSNKFKSDFFSHKFLASWPKLLQLKGLDLKVSETTHEVLYAPEIENYCESFLYLPIEHDTLGLIGFVILGQSFISEALHFMLGGSSNVELLQGDKALTNLEKKSLEGLYGPLQLSVREGLKGLLGIHNIHITKNWERLDLEKELSQNRSYFCEDYNLIGQHVVKMQIYFRVEAFTPH